MQDKTSQLEILEALRRELLRERDALRRDNLGLRAELAMLSAQQQQLEASRQEVQAQLGGEGPCIKDEETRRLETAKGTQTRFQVLPRPMADFATGTTRHAPVSTEPRHETGGASPVHNANPVGSTPSPRISSGRTLASQGSEASAPGRTMENPGEACVTRPTG